MAGKILAQLILVGTQVVGRAFMEAYRQAAAQGIKQAVSKSAQGSSPVQHAFQNELTKKTGISLEEAAQILNVDGKSACPQQIQTRFDHLFKVNDKASGGSFYLQSKVFRARERLQMERDLEEAGKARDGTDTAKRS